MLEHNYSSQYFEHLEKGYYPFSYLRDKVIIHFVKKLIPKGKKILELGCGTGRFITQLENDYVGYGIDISPYAIAEAKKRTRKVTFSNTTIEECDRFSIQFDGVIAINVIEHLKDPEVILKKINTILKQGGFLFIHMPTASNRLSKFLLNRFYKDETHIFIPSLLELNSILSQCGFSLICQRSGTFIFLPISSTKLLEITPPYFAILLSQR